MYKDLPRPKSAAGLHTRYNPIIPSEQPLIDPKPGKAQITQTFLYSRYPQERPKGKVISEFSKNSASTFKIGSSENVTYRPSIKVNIQQTSYNFSRPQSIRVDGYTRNRTPLVRECPPTRPRVCRGSPSPILRYENERKNCLPSEMGINTHNPLVNCSRVFEDTQESYLFNGKFKCLLDKPTEIKSVIGYEYALPYREQKVTGKV